MDQNSAVSAGIGGISIHLRLFLFVRSQSNVRLLTNENVGKFLFDQHSSADFCILTAKESLPSEYNSAVRRTPPSTINVWIGVSVCFFVSWLADHKNK